MGSVGEAIPPAQHKTKETTQVNIMISLLSRTPNARATGSPMIRSTLHRSSMFSDSFTLRPSGDLAKGSQLNDQPLGILGNPATPRTKGPKNQFDPGTPGK
jgi:hypothetical protein